MNSVWDWGGIIARICSGQSAVYYCRWVEAARRSPSIHTAGSVATLAMDGMDPGISWSTGVKLRAAVPPTMCVGMYVTCSTSLASRQDSHSLKEHAANRDSCSHRRAEPDTRHTRGSAREVTCSPCLGAISPPQTTASRLPTALPDLSMVKEGTQSWARYMSTCVGSSCIGRC
jgi:hypothetical protein